MKPTPITIFHNAVYSDDKGCKTITALCQGKNGYRFRDWSSGLRTKRENFEAYVISMYTRDQAFIRLLESYYNKLKRSLDRYNRSKQFDKNYDLKTQRRLFLTQKYHIERRRQISIAYEFLRPLFEQHSVKEERQSQNPRDPNCFSNLYTPQQLDAIFDYLVQEHYLEHPYSKDAFIYYFSGAGKQEDFVFRWRERANTHLTIFIKTFFPNESKIWHKTQKIFGVRNLSKITSRWVSDRSKYAKEINIFENLHREIMGVK